MQGFLAFEMDEVVADANDYPMLTDAIKAKIMGLNAARIYGVDVAAKRCELTDDAFAHVRRQYRDAMARHPAPIRPSQLYKGPRSRRDFFKVWAKTPNFPA
jgi:hypothetical protein